MGPEGFDGNLIRQNELVKLKVASEIASDLNSGLIPEHLKIGRVVLLSKIKGQEAVKVEDILLITIKSHIFKEMEKSIIARVKTGRIYLLGTRNY